MYEVAFRAVRYSAPVTFPTIRQTYAVTLMTGDTGSSPANVVLSVGTECNRAKPTAPEEWTSPSRNNVNGRPVTNGVEETRRAI